MRKYFTGTEWEKYPPHFVPYLQAAYETLKFIGEESLMEIIGNIALSCKTVEELHRKINNFMENLGDLHRKLQRKADREK